MRLTLLIFVTGFTFVASPNFLFSGQLQDNLETPNQQFESIFQSVDRNLIANRNTSFARDAHMITTKCQLGCPIADKIDTYQSTETALQQGTAFIRSYKKAVDDFASRKKSLASDIENNVTCNGQECNEAKVKATAALDALADYHNQNLQYLNATLATYRGNFTNNEDQIREASSLRSNKPQIPPQIADFEKTFAGLRNGANINRDDKMAGGQIANILSQSRDPFNNINATLTQADLERTNKALSLDSIPACQKAPDSAKCKRAVQDLWAANATGPVSPARNTITMEKCGFWEKYGVLEQPIRNFVAMVAGTAGYFMAEANGYDNKWAMFLSGVAGPNSEIGRRYGMIMAGGNPDGINLGAMGITPGFTGPFGTPGSNMSIGAGSPIFPALSPFPNASGRSEYGQANAFASSQAAMAGGYSNPLLQGTVPPTGLTNAMNASGAGSNNGTNRVGTSTANSVFGYYNSAYANMGNQAKDFNSQFGATADQYKNYNAGLMGLTSSYNPSLPAAYAGTAKQSLNNVKAGGSTDSRVKSTDDEVDSLLKSGVTTPTSAQTSFGTSASTTNIRLELSRIEEQRKELTAMASSRSGIIAENYLNFNWGSRNARNEAMRNMVRAQAELSMLQNMIAANEGYNNVYRSVIVPYLYTALDFTPEAIIDAIFDLKILYADNSNSAKSKNKTLSLSKVKTSYTINYKYKPGWDKALVDYAIQMVEKAKETKTKLAVVKKKINEELSKELPNINPKKIPNKDAIVIQISNMDSLREASEKNMKLIDAALEYQKKRNGKNRELISKYEQEANSLKTSMTELVKTINVVYGDIQKSYEIVDTLNLEKPKAESLRQVAKEMVEKGL